MLTVRSMLASRGLRLLSVRLVMSLATEDTAAKMLSASLPATWDPGSRAAPPGPASMLTVTAASRPADATRATLPCGIRHPSATVKSTRKSMDPSRSMGVISSTWPMG